MKRKDNLFKFIISYVGSKAYWVKFLKEKYSNSHIVESFCGSAVLSANLAKECVLNDSDPYIYKILSEFNTLIVPETFTREDYFRVRSQEDWYKYIYCLQKLSFSGVFRYSKNGFNVPIKSDQPIHVRENYLEAKKRWEELSPVVLNRQYYELNEYIREDSVLILDPPYENSQTAYNGKNFDYHFYWQYIRLNENICKTVIIFDYECNLPFDAQQTKKMRVNGAKAGNIESVNIIEESTKEGHAGEKLFYSLFSEKIDKSNDNKHDFISKKTQEKIKLQSDYYSTEKTNNFFFEIFSEKQTGKKGGPFKAIEDGNELYIYFFVPNKKMFTFKTSELVKKLTEIQNQYEDINIPNKSHITVGKKIPIQELKDLFKEHTLTNVSVVQTEESST